jgi:hypothetical protein
MRELAPDSNEKFYYNKYNKEWLAFNSSGLLSGFFLMKPHIETHYSHSKEGVKCISIGPLANTQEYAIKRPIAKSDKYECRRTLFEVTECFGKCRAAVVKIFRPDTKIGLPVAYFVVDDCIGIVSIDVEPCGRINRSPYLLKSKVGILENELHPTCPRFPVR